MPAQWTAEAAIDFMDRHSIASQILSVPWAFNAAARRRLQGGWCMHPLRRVVNGFVSETRRKYRDGIEQGLTPETAGRS
jgi:hypothetical protein